VSRERGIKHLFPDFKNGTFIPSDLQEKASDFYPNEGPHLIIIEESTGSGKTEAALTLAHQLMVSGQGHGVYFGLPTMATSNALHGRILKIKDNFYENGENPPVILAHSVRHLSHLFLDDNPDCDLVSDPESKLNDLSSWLADNRKKALLAPIGVGTIDQALVSVLPRRHQSLRLFGIWRNVLIIDEVHAYDPYVTELLKGLVQVHTSLGGSTILVSATLPRVTRDYFIQAFYQGIGKQPEHIGPSPYPVLLHLSPDERSEHALSPRPGTSREVSLLFFNNEDEVHAALEVKTEKGSCACWIRNTVQDALDAYQALKRSTPSATLMLFHARFILGDRLEKEREVLKKFGRSSTNEERSSTVLVATQVVEQSLDLDFDFMVTDLAPIDLIIQRAGRLQRHNRGDRIRPNLGIYAPEFAEEPEASWFEAKFRRGAFVYSNHSQLWLTLKILQNKGTLRTPDDSRVLIEGVYGKDCAGACPKSLLIRDQQDQKDRAARGYAMTNMIRFNQGYQDSGMKWPASDEVPTRLAEPSVTLRLGCIDTVGGRIHPLYESGEFSWDLSQVSVLKKWIGEGICYDHELIPLIHAAERSMRDGGTNALLIPLRQISERTWENRFSRSDGGILFVRYSKEMGLELQKEV